MKRIIENKLLLWKKKNKRKPLIIKGARQVGKTYIVQEFGKKYFKEFHYFNFEENKNLIKIFKPDLNLERIISELSIFINKKIDIKNDLIIFDEIQFSPEALTSLKYFYEKFPDSFIISAGSLLGIHLNENISSFPVGKVEFLEMYPINFYEFLISIESKELAEIYNKFQLDKKISDFIHYKLLKAFKIYLITGGLPEVVQFFSENKNLNYNIFSIIRNIQKNLMTGYEADIAKYSGKLNSMHILRILDTIPAQLSKNVNGSLRRFKFKGIIPNKKSYSSISSLIDWLLNSGLILKEYIVKDSIYPLKHHIKENMFKLYLFDVGMLGFLSNLEPEVITGMDFGNFKGYFIENYIFQELVAQGFKDIYTWHGKESEIEFLIEFKDKIIPIEVKSGENLKAKSFIVYRKKYNPEIAIKFSTKKPLLNKNGIINLPIYLAGKLKEIILNL